RSEEETMRLKLQLLDERLVQRILSEAFELLVSPGVRVGSEDALDLLKNAGASTHDDAVRIPEGVVRRALNSGRRKFSLYDRQGRAAVRYGWNQVQFDPGSSCLNILDSETQEPRPAIASDLVRMVQVAEMLPQFAAQSMAMVPSDVPAEMADWYRLLLVLWHSDKPVVTGAFSVSTLRTMLELLAAEVGGPVAMTKKP